MVANWVAGNVMAASAVAGSDMAASGRDEGVTAGSVTAGGRMAWVCWLGV